MNEFEAIEHIFAHLRSAQIPKGELGIGDDGALLNLPNGEQLVVSTDTLVSNVHFPNKYAPALLAQRALAVSASDLVAMGASPVGCLLALTLPTLNQSWLISFTSGLELSAMKQNLKLYGGDTTQGPLSITVTVLGSVPKGQALRRDQAQVGHMVCVSGNLGAAAAAVTLVTKRRLNIPSALARQWLKSYWTPELQWDLAKDLRPLGGAAIDISDGLLAEADHLAKRSQVKICLDTKCIPLAPGLHAYGAKQAWAWALAGGDDYQLLFTLPPSALQSIQRKYPGVTSIGWVEQGEGVDIKNLNHKWYPKNRGYQHF